MPHRPLAFLPHRAFTHPPTLLLCGLLLQIGVSFLPDPLPPRVGAVPLAGGLLILLGVAANVIAVRHFERAGTPVRPNARPRVLVTSGIFARTRNPMYLGLSCILFGSALALRSLWALLPAVGFSIWVDRLVDHEEAALAGELGGEYHGYRARTPRWL
jgi:protein-S-isoprenylcysteine O-methyltransferase Ste14